MKTRLIKKELLKYMPIKFYFIDEIKTHDTTRVLKTRIIENSFYNAKETYCHNNYRKTSKLLNPDEIK